MCFSWGQCVSRISVRNYTVLTLKTDQTVWGWGSGGIYGGNGDWFSRSPLQLNTGSFQNIFVGDDAVFVLDNVNNLWANGSNQYGSFGNGNTSSGYYNFEALGNYPGLKSLTSGLYFGALIKGDGSLWTWGYNNSYQVGDDTTTPRLSPVHIGSDTNW
ncbi:MAG: hypothetical protein CFE24_14275 [Flavobacterium sp. BFFFF2]|nr:MAG: hypothetical protein CFE24_14275 [Flavobacterium sp. BFFFF2]